MTWPINTVNVQYIAKITILYMNVDMYNVDISLNCRWTEEKTSVTADRSSHVGWTERCKYCSLCASVGEQKLV